jgi:GGDEF domain-containing protein
MPAPLAIVLCDVVGLKAVNERLGFAAGDTQLRGAADRLRSAATDAAILARLGGDELVAVFTGPHALAAAERAAANLGGGSQPPLRAAAAVQKQGENCGALIDRLYAIVRRS